MARKRASDYTIIVSINNPEEWGLEFKKPGRENSWCKYPMDYLMNPKIGSLDRDAKWVFWAIITQAHRSQKTHNLHINGLLLCHLLHINGRLMANSIQQLQALSLIDRQTDRQTEAEKNNSTIDGLVYGNTETCPEGHPPDGGDVVSLPVVSTSLKKQVRGRKRDPKTPPIAKPPREAFPPWLLTAWNAYPRQEGFTRNCVKVRQMVDESDADDFLKAVVNYGQHCRARKTEKQYIRSFANFALDWHDWLRPPGLAKFEYEISKDPPRPRFTPEQLARIDYLEEKLNSFGPDKISLDEYRRIMKEEGLEYK